VQKFGSALVPDFQQFYNLRFTQVIREWGVKEVLLLIAGLPEESRLFARMMGEKQGQAWSKSDWVLFDLRNSVEALRVMQANSDGKKRTSFNQYKVFPGHEVQERKQAERTLAAWRARLAAGSGVEQLY
jgi:hypothetical protein